MMQHSLRKRQTIFLEKPGEKDLQAQGISPVRVNQQFSARNVAPAGHKRRTSLYIPSGGNSARRQRSPSGSRQWNLSVSIPEDFVADGAITAGSRHTENDLDVDPALGSGTVDARSYIAAKLTSASPEDIEQFADTLRQQFDAMNKNEKATIQRNYETLLTVSRDISDLAPQVSDLRKLIAELRLVTEAIKQDAEAQLSTDKGIVRSQSQLSIGSDLGARANSTNRNSLLMLSNMWARDLMTLFKRVEGAQKYLPGIPGRHVVLESGSWYELNPVTWQPVKPIHVFLMNDHLLLATKKKSRQQGASTGLPGLIVDHCWPLAEISLDDLSKENVAAGSSIQIQVRSAGFQGLYSASSATGLRSLVSEFQKSQMALSTSRMVSGSLGKRQSHSHRRQQSTATQKSGSESLSVENRREALKTIADIDLQIAHHLYSEAVQALEAVDKSSMHEILGAQIETRRASLAKTLLKQLEENTGRDATVRTIAVLCRLGKSTEARSAFLDSRIQLLTQRLSRVNFYGDIVRFVSQTAVTYFQLIKSTIDIYRQAFQENDESSIIVEWAKSQVDSYVDFFNRQLFNIGKKTSIYEQCVEVSRQESGQLRELGLDMDFLLSYVWGEI